MEGLGTNIILAVFAFGFAALFWGFFKQVFLGDDDNQKQLNILVWCIMGGIALMVLFYLPLVGIGVIVLTYFVMKE